MADIVDFLAEIGADKINYQPLHTCMESADMNKGRTTVKFATDVSALDLCEKRTAVICWVSAEDYTAALTKLRGEQDNGD